MNSKKTFILLAVVSLYLFCVSSMASAGDTLYFVLMASKDPVKEVQKFKALSNYISSRTSDIDTIKLKVARDYPHAVELFKSVKVNGMFAGSCVAAVLIKKGLAVPVVRPLLSKDDLSTYKALIISKKELPMFNGISDFKGKKVAYCALASSGEIFARTLLKKGESPSDYYIPLLSMSHQEAINAVANGSVDYAVVKNLVWDEKKYPTLAVVGGDSAKNPNNTLILANNTYARVGNTIEKILIDISNDDSPFTSKVKEVFKIKGFIKTTNKDFEHTFDLLKSAHINPAKFDFKF